MAGNETEMKTKNIIIVLAVICLFPLELLIPLVRHKTPVIAPAPAKPSPVMFTFATSFDGTNWTTNSSPFPIQVITDRFAMLSEIESGDDDRAIGLRGEISRYQMKQAVWSAHTSLPMSAARNPFTAQSVARAVAGERCAAFAAKFHRQPNDFEFYVLWNAPACYLDGPVKIIPKEVFDRAERFARLCQ
jgi:hypothetical protein